MQSMYWLAVPAKGAPRILSRDPRRNMAKDVAYFKLRITRNGWGEMGGAVDVEIPAAFVESATLLSPPDETLPE